MGGPPTGVAFHDGAPQLDQTDRDGLVRLRGKGYVVRGILHSPGTVDAATAAAPWRGVGNRAVRTARDERLADRPAVRPRHTPKAAALRSRLHAPGAPRDDRLEVVGCLLADQHRGAGAHHATS
jgi:hypothetical protein